MVTTNPYASNNFFPEHDPIVPTRTREASIGDASVPAQPRSLQFNLRMPSGGSTPFTLTGDPRVLVALLFAKDAEESLLPLQETAAKLQAASDKREMIRELKKLFNQEAMTTESDGHTATLSVEELNDIMAKAQALGIDTAPLDAIKRLAESGAGADSAEGRIIGLEFQGHPELHTERQKLLEDVRDVFDEATEASRDSQTTINFEIQLQMQNHTNLYTAASQTVAELKRQNGAVAIS